MSLKKKLLLYNLVLSTFLVISGGIGYLGSKNASTKYEHVVQVNMRINEALSLMEQAKTRTLFNLYRMAHPSFSWDERDQILEMLNERVSKYKLAEETYRSISQLDSSDAELYKGVAESWKVIESHNQKFIDYTKARSEDGLQAMQTMMKENLEKDRLKYDQAIASLVDYHRVEADKWVQAAQQTSQYSTSLGMLALVAALFASVASGLLIGQGMSRQISKLADRLTESSSGVFQESVKVSTASTQLAAAMAEQASAIQETVSAVDEISAMVSKTADNSTQSQAESSRMSDVAMKGKEAVDQVVVSISQISEGNTQILHQIEHGNSQLEKIVTLINQITDKTKVINDIVFQTKLLSFNASVEAARAGEHGKGFAVVAEEVGNLAAMSGNAAKDISNMLDASTHEVKKIVGESKEAIASLLERTRGKFEDSQAVARECAQIFDQIITQMQAVSRNVNDIATASREQTTGIREINRVMNSLSDATQQNSHTTGETANSAMELKRQAEDVKTTVGELMTLVTGQINDESVVKPVMKAINPKVLAKVERANFGVVSEKAGSRAEAVNDKARKSEVTMTSKTKPIAGSALIEVKKPNSKVISLLEKKSADKKAAHLKAQTPNEVKDIEPVTPTTAQAVGGEFENFPSSDDDRFEKV